MNPSPGQWPQRPSGKRGPWDSARGRRNVASGPDAQVMATPREVCNGRVLAYTVLQQLDASDRFLQDLMATADGTHRLSAAERGLAVDVAAGVVRRRRTLDVLLQSQIARPQAQLEPDLWQVLRIGAWQLLFGRTPDHAAVDTTVELCRLLERERWTRFVNGVLRNLGRLLLPDLVDVAASDTIPVANGQFRPTLSPVFADPDREPERYVADAFSLPSVLAARWTSRMSRDDLFRACFHAVTPPRLSLRCNPLKSTVDQVISALDESGFRATRGKHPQCVLVEHAARIDQLPGFESGEWSVQDESAMHAADLLNPQAGELILDLCAAPGGKTTHLAEISRDAAEILACDVSGVRLKRVVQNAERLGLHSIRTVEFAVDGSGLPMGPFDAILVDVPCSNTGVLGRRPEARWRFSEADLAELVLLQSRLLAAACERLKPGGRIVYSTCSVEDEENSGVVQSVLQQFPGLRLERTRQFLPGQPSDGACQSLLRLDDTPGS